MTSDEPPESASGVTRMRLFIVTLFPRLFAGWLEQGVVARAVQRGIVDLTLVNLREFGVGRHQITDDYPFGGGAGMVMKPEPIFAAVESLPLTRAAPRILLSPRGRLLRQPVAQALAAEHELVLICGHYEGVDERVREHLITDEISIGDYVLSSGELAAMATADAVVRLLPGALASDSTEEESFGRGLLEYPQYTRPARFRDWSVPDVLVSGNHGEVDRWRRRRAVELTARRRPDLLLEAELSQDERDWAGAAHLANHEDGA
ncbi:MAG TPA: tRNA (guanosine(37)-N1)-methyltransferase TrmD [Chloroflexota bacterium]|nr:tRNA (guanosine(37)-N1)-methyltransferase TrmD [Chloroflexota bacterium]